MLLLGVCLIYCTLKWGVVEHVVAGGVLYLLQLEVGLVEHVVVAGGVSYLLHIEVGGG